LGFASRWPVNSDKSATARDRIAISSRTHLERSKSETLGDDTSESTESSTWSGAANVHPSPQPSLGIHKGLLDLVPLPLGRLGTGVVLPQPLDGDETVVALLEELGGGRRVGHEVPNDRGHSERQETETEEDALIRFKRGLAVSDTVGEERSEDGSHRVGDLPSDGSVGLFSSSPPHLGDQDEGGENGAV